MANRMWVWWVLAVVGVLVAGGLGALVAVGDLDTADQVASVVGAVVGLCALGVSLYALRRPSAAESAPRSASADRGSIAAEGNITNSTARDTGSAVPAQAENGVSGMRASRGSIVSGGNIDRSNAQHGDSS